MFDNLTVRDLQQLASSNGEVHTYFHLKKHIATGLSRGVGDVVIMAELVGFLEGLTSGPTHAGKKGSVAE